MKISRLLFISILISGLTFSSSSHAQIKRDYTELDKYISKAISDFQVPGVAVGIIKNGEVTFAKGYGYRSTETKEPVDTKTIFGIASCTKAFTAASIGILNDEGMLKWDDEVISHYPEFQLYDPYITRDFRVDDLLCHRSGYETFDGDLLWYGTDYTREEVLKRFRYRKNTYGFRREFGYSNLMFIAAGEMLESVTGESWDDFVKKNIFEPLGMNSTTTTNSGFNPDMDIALPHLDGKPVDFIRYDNIGPAGSINSSVDDMLKWIELWLNKGVYNGDTVFSLNVYNTTTMPHTNLKWRDEEVKGGTHFYSYGLGWFMNDYDGVKVLQHGGGLPGFHSKVVLIPSENVGFVILSNQLSGLVEALYHKLLDFNLDIKNPKDWAAIYLKRKHAQDAQGEISQHTNTVIIDTESGNPSLTLDNYTGVYEDEMYGKAEVSLKKGKLHLSLLPAKELLSGDLEHFRFDTFKFRFNDRFLKPGKLTFYINEEAEPEYFTINLDSDDFLFGKLKFVKAK
jgi:CubicO group peptidase (beta-lactamase class C family)